MYVQQVKAIIFDCFGVLVEASLEPFCRKYFGNDANKIAQVKFLDTQANSGLMTYMAFVAELARLANISVDEAQQFLDSNPANEELLTYIRDILKPHYKIGVLSNASDNWLAELFTPGQLKLFDDVVLSFEHGLIKPDPAIFRLAAQRLGVQLAECIFIDDIPRYCNGAARAGMQSICYESVPQLKAALANLVLAPPDS
jgi:epoxide hydrolase-like predicted phosphatase